MRTNGRMDMDDNRDSHRNEGSKFGPFALGLIVGGAIGAALALLYAPAEGSELRRGMSEKLDDLVDGAKDIIRNAKTTAEKMFTEGLGSEEEEQPSTRTRERADDILEDADRAIAEARRRSSTRTRTRRDEDEDEE